MFTRENQNKINDAINIGMAIKQREDKTYFINYVCRDVYRE